MEKQDQHKTFIRPFVCPKCKNKLYGANDLVLCCKCGAAYSSKEGIFDFLLGEKFEDIDDIKRALHEEKTSTYLIHNYLAPLLLSLFKSPEGTSILSVGCGVGMEVDLLLNYGFDCYGIDCGSRSNHWDRRDYKANLSIANGKAMPFESNYFDALFSGGVIEHIGVYGDTYKTTQEYLEQRIAFATELVRVVKPYGKLVLSCPNRLFPADLFHRGDRLFMRPHLPSEKFLLSLKDFERLFIKECGCKSLELLPINNYWGFLRTNYFLLGKIVRVPARVYFNLISKFRVLRKSFLNPWLVVLITK
jgi:SAM-dependent methyltransferase